MDVNFERMLELSHVPCVNRALVEALAKWEKDGLLKIEEEYEKRRLDFYKTLFTDEWPLSKTQLYWFDAQRYEGTTWEIVMMEPGVFYEGMQYEVLPNDIMDIMGEVLPDGEKIHALKETYSAEMEKYVDVKYVRMSETHMVGVVRDFYAHPANETIAPQSLPGSYDGGKKKDAMEDDDGHINVDRLIRLLRIREMQNMLAFKLKELETGPLKKKIDAFEQKKEEWLRTLYHEKPAKPDFRFILTRYSPYWWKVSTFLPEPEDGEYELLPPRNEDGEFDMDAGPGFDTFDHSDYLPQKLMPQFTDVPVSETEVYKKSLKIDLVRYLENEKFMEVEYVRQSTTCIVGTLTFPDDVRAESKKRK
ncbi:MAG: hypothetical protein GY765_10765 [bacterium]|nr:hypothetical protein [bacterium]